MADKPSRKFALPLAHSWHRDIAAVAGANGLSRAAYVRQSIYRALKRDLARQAQEEAGHQHEGEQE